MTAYAARLRFRVLTSLTIDEVSRDIVVGGRPVTLKSADEKPIRESDWLVFLARGFTSEADARIFGEGLQRAVELSSAATRLGVDVGVGKPTSGLYHAVRDDIRCKHGIDVRPNIHGLDIFADTPEVRFFGMKAAGRVSARPDEFIAKVDQMHSVDFIPYAPLSDSILLLNRALMQPNPVARIVFLVSAVEMLGQNEKWSQAQRNLLEHLAQGALTSAVGSDADRQEVADAVRKLHRLSLRQGVLRLLSRLGLKDLREPWDVLYERRSSLMHASKTEPGADYSPLAHHAASLCGRIILKAASLDAPGMADHIDARYPVPLRADINGC